jgi:hypothetical protein
MKKHEKTRPLSIGLAPLAVLALSLAVTGAAHADVTGTYEVPVPTSLAPDAAFPLPNTGWRAAPEGQVLSYTLPEDLVGASPVNIRLVGAAPTVGGGFSAFSSDQANASCTTAGSGRVLCLVQYKRDIFGPNPSAFSRDAQSFLRAKYLDSDSLQNKLAVQALFQNEPAGVVSFVAPPEIR